MTPEERAQDLRLAVQMNIEAMDGGPIGTMWMLNDKGFSKIAAAIREAENEAYERALAAIEKQGDVSDDCGESYGYMRAINDAAKAVTDLKHQSGT